MDVDHLESQRNRRVRRERRMPYSRGNRIDRLVNQRFSFALHRLREVSPYLKSTSLHFFRNVTRTGNIDITRFHSQDVDYFLGYILHMPVVLADHEFEDAKHAAFAINLKNVYDSQMLVPFSDIRITDASFLPWKSEEFVDVRDGVNYRFVDIGRIVNAGDYPFMRMMVKYGIFQNISVRRLGNDCEDKLRRVTMVTGAIQTIHRRYDPPLKEQAEKILACLRLYFEAVPEPFVTPQEIEPFLESVVAKESQREDFRMAYRAAFPDYDVLQPRTLKHLSCCALRDGLCKRGQLPVLLSKLPVPRSIREYVQIV